MDVAIGMVTDAAMAPDCGAPRFTGEMPPWLVLTSEACAVVLTGDRWEWATELGGSGFVFEYVWCCCRPLLSDGKVETELGVLGMPRADANACVSNDGPDCLGGPEPGAAVAGLTVFMSSALPCVASLLRPTGGVAEDEAAPGTGGAGLERAALVVTATSWPSGLAMAVRWAIDSSARDDCDGGGCCCVPVLARLVVPVLGAVAGGGAAVRLSGLLLPTPDPRAWAWVGLPWPTAAGVSGAGGAAFSGSECGLDMRKTSGAARRRRGSNDSRQMQDVAAAGGEREKGAKRGRGGVGVDDGGKRVGGRWEWEEK